MDVRCKLKRCKIYIHIFVFHGDGLGSHGNAYRFPHWRRNMAEVSEIIPCRLAHYFRPTAFRSFSGFTLLVYNLWKDVVEQGTPDALRVYLNELEYRVFGRDPTTFR